MPDSCCVPQCKGRNGGHRFPNEPELRQRWVAAINKLDRGTLNLWQPKKSSVVCKHHFTKDDYNDTLMGNFLHIEIIFVNLLYKE